MSSHQLDIIRITGKQIKGESICCTGAQLRELLDQISSWVNDCAWYLSDVKINNSAKICIAGELQKQRLSSEALSNLCSQVDQFLSGIFLAVPTKIVKPRLNSGILTEDEPSSDLGDAILEIRAFDTSYFELYTADDKLANYVVKLYQADLIKASC